jgi:hypothetical protein
MLCRTYGSLEKSYGAAASYGAKVESGKLKAESEELKKDKVTTVKVVSMACPNETKNTSEAAGRGIAKELVRAEQTRKLKGKSKKGNKKTKANKKVNKNGNKNGNMREKRIRGKP